MSMLVRQQLAVFMVSLLLCGTAFPRNYPVKISSTNRHILVDQSNVPFLIHGDCAWGLMVAVDQPGVEQYLENRRQKGFNTVVVMLISDHSFINGNATTNRYGVEPFASGHDFTTPDETYFRNADRVIDLAGQKGIQVLLAPCYVGFDSTEGWQNLMVLNGTTNCRSYGRFLGQRYKDKPNITWLHSGDNGDPTYFPYIREIALGIKEYDTNHLATAKLWPEQSARDLLSGESWLDCNTTYAYGIEGFSTYTRRVYAKTVEDFNGTPTMPSFLVESTFEHEHGAEAYWVRRQAYWSVLSGSSGQIMGNYYIWPFYSGWQTTMDGTGSVSMSHLKKLFDSRPWYSMVPDQNHTVITSGYGTFGTDDYLTAMRTTNGNTVIAYVPTSRAFSVDMSRISGTQAKAWWFSTQDGSATNFATYSSTGSRNFTPPGTNDWVLVLDDAAVPFTPPGSAPGPLEVITSSLTAGAIGVAYSVPFLAQGGIEPFSWSQPPNSAPLPTGLSFSTNGVLSGIPAINGTFNLVVMVADSTTATVTQNLRLTIEIPDTTPPTAPPGLTALAVSTSQIDLSWGTSTDNVAVTVYRVERCQGAGCTNFTPMATLPGTNFSSVRLRAETSYCYRVQARDAAGNLSSYSAVASATSLSAPPPSTGPVSAYDFEEKSGPTVADWSGHGNTGTINGATWTTQGKSGNALSFSGSSRVMVNGSDSLNLVNGMTLEAWVYPTASSGWSTAIFKEEFHDLAYGLFPSSGVGRPNLSMITSSGLQGVDGTSALPLNTWSHLAGTYDGVNLRLYINGTQVATTSASGSIITSTNALYVGGNPAFGEFFQGTIDDVRIYNRALNQDEIQSDINNVPVLFAINRTELVPNRLNLYFTAAAGQSYAMEYRDSLTSGSWLTLTNINVPPVLTNLVMAGLDTSQPQRFYQVNNVSQPGQPVDIHLVMLAPGILNLNFTASAGQSYTVEYCNSLNSGAWLTLNNLSLPTVLTNAMATDFNTSQSQRYYHLKNLSPTGQPASFDRAEFLPASFDLYFNTDANRSYTIEYRDALSSGSWQPLTNIKAPAVTTNLVVSDFDRGQPQRFYRVRSP